MVDNVVFPSIGFQTNSGSSVMIRSIENVSKKRTFCGQNNLPPKSDNFGGKLVRKLVRKSMFVKGVFYGHWGFGENKMVLIFTYILFL